MVEFYLRIYFDVLLELLRFGCRRRLSKLERAGRRFHWLVEKWFPDVPFLRLNLELKPATGYTFLLPINFNQTNKSFVCTIVYTASVVQEFWILVSSKGTTLISKKRNGFKHFTDVKWNFWTGIRTIHAISCVIITSFYVLIRLMGAEVWS